MQHFAHAFDASSRRRDIASALVGVLRGIAADEPAASSRLAANVDGVASIVSMAHLTTLHQSLRGRRGIFFASGGGRRVQRARDLAAAVAAPGLSGGRVTDSVVFDLDRGYVLDGDLQPANGPYTVRVDVGASARMLVP